jgi:Tol biopolymer transport system component
MLLDGHIAWAFFWAPDSKSFGFFEDGKLKTSDVSGAPPQTLSDAPFPVGGGAWGTRGVIVFSSGGVLHKVQAAGGQPAQITSLDPSLQETEHLAPYFLPDGVHYLYLALSGQPSNSAVYVGSIESKERTRLFASESPALYAAAGPGKGYLLFNRGNAMFAQPFDSEARKFTGEPTRLSDAAPRLGGALSGQFLSPNENKMANIAVSQNGVLAYRSAGSVTAGQPQAVAGMTLVWFSRSGGAASVGTPASYAGVDLAPDGKRFAVHQHEGDGGDSWFFDSGRMQRLTFNTAQDNSMPIWSHDGTKIAFGSKRNGKWGAYVKASDGTGQEELIVESELPTMPMSWSPDGKLLVYWVNDPKTRGDLWMVPVAGDRKPVALLQTPADESLAQVSPDGKWIAYQSDETGGNQIYVSPFPSGSGNRSQISTEGGVWPRWRGDGKELFFNLAPNIMAADIRISGQSVQPGVPHILFARQPVVHGAAWRRLSSLRRHGRRAAIPNATGSGQSGGRGWRPRRHARQQRRWSHDGSRPRECRLRQRRAQLDPRLDEEIDGLSALFPRVFVGGHLVGPRGHPAEPDIDLHGRLIGSGAVPVEHIRRRVVALARTELPDGLIALLQTHPSLFYQQQLPLSVAVPVGARTGIEPPPCDIQILCVHCGGRPGDAWGDGALGRLLSATRPDG